MGRRRSQLMRIDEILIKIPKIDVLQAARDAVQVPAWIVGGAVRDLFLGHVPVDVDVATPQPEPLARHFADLVDGRVVPMDPEHDIWRVAFNGEYFDFCGFRDHDIIGDLTGRDFTFNAIALRLPESESPGGLLDPFHGVEDLQAGVLRMVSPVAFRDDPVRILRAFRFLSELRLTVEDATWGALQMEADRLPLSAVERLQAEWWKLCAGPNAAEAIQRMDNAGVLGILFPELQATKGVAQNVYHRFDVWEHLLLTATHMVRFLQNPEEIFQDLLPDFAPILDNPQRHARLVFIALIHDIGKPPTRTRDNGKVHFYHHEITGAALAGDICRRLRMSKEDTRAVITIIRNHMRPLFMLIAQQQRDLSRKAMMKFFDASSGFAIDILALAMADKTAGQGPAADPDVLEHLRELARVLMTFYREIYQPSITHPVLTGRDLTQELRLPPGPQLGDLLSQARQLQILGKLTSHDEALRWAARQQSS